MGQARQPCSTCGRTPGTPHRPPCATAEAIGVLRKLRKLQTMLTQEGILVKTSGGACRVLTLEETLAWARVREEKTGDQAPK